MKYLYIFILILISFSCAHKSEPWTTTEKTFAVASVLATAADTYTTLNMLDNPNNYEMNPIMGKHPSDGRVILTMAATELILLAICHYYKDLRLFLLGSKTVINSYWAIHNNKLE